MLKFNQTQKCLQINSLRCHILKVYCKFCTFYIDMPFEKELINDYDIFFNDLIASI